MWWQTFPWDWWLNLEEGTALPCAQTRVSPPDMWWEVYDQFSAVLKCSCRIINPVFVCLNCSRGGVELLKTWKKTCNRKSCRSCTSLLERITCFSSVVKNKPRALPVAHPLYSFSPPFSCALLTTQFPWGWLAPTRRALWAAYPGISGAALWQGCLWALAHRCEGGNS